MQNIHRINFGIRQDGHAVNDVELPPWAQSKQTIFGALLGRIMCIALLWPIAAPVVAWSVCVSSCLLETFVIHIKTAEPIEMRFGMWTRVGLSNQLTMY